MAIFAKPVIEIVAPLISDTVVIAFVCGGTAMVLAWGCSQYWPSIRMFTKRVSRWINSA